MRTLTLILSLLASSSLAQVSGLCGAGRDCTVGKLYSVAPLGTYAPMCWFNPAQPGYSWGVSLTTSNLTMGEFAGNRCANPVNTSVGRINLNLNNTYVNLIDRATTGDGLPATPSWSFYNDPDTGLYKVGANELGVANGGARSFNFSYVNGRLEGTASTTYLILNTATGTQLGYGGSTLTLDGSRIALSAATSGITVAAQAPTSFPSGTARTLVADQYSNGLFWQGSSSATDTPPFDFGGKAHPTLQRRTYVLDVGVESSATPTWNPTPRVGASSVTMTMVDAAPAGGTTLGASPTLVDVRTSVTTAAAASTSTAIASAAFVRRDHGIRWCQVMAVSAKTNARIWTGLSTALPGASDTPAATDFAAFRSSSAAGDGNWQFCTKDGATQSCTDTTVSVATGTAAAQTLCIDCRGETGACTAWVDGVAKVRKTTNLPTATTKLAPFFTVETLAASALTFYAGPMSVELR